MEKRIAKITVTDCRWCPHRRAVRETIRGLVQDVPLCAFASGVMQIIDCTEGFPSWCPLPSKET